MYITTLFVENIFMKKQDVIKDLLFRTLQHDDTVINTYKISHFPRKMTMSLLKCQETGIGRDFQSEYFVIYTTLNCYLDIPRLYTHIHTHIHVHTCVELEDTHNSMLTNFSNFIGILCVCVCITNSCNKKLELTEVLHQPKPFIYIYI